jgi:4-methyl-5(b-hydroxyethyl)-thiazole monophosphate biosynthesis
MGKRALIVIPNGFEEVEFCCPFDILMRGGIDVLVAGYDGTELTGAHGLQVRAKTELSDAALAMYDCILLPGGAGCYAMRGDTALVEFLARHAAANELLCAICAAPLILHDAGLLRGHKYTAHPATHDELADASTGKNVVIDGNLITGSGPGAAAEFGFAILWRLAGEETANKIRKSMLF